MKDENQRYTEEELRNLPDDERTKLIMGLIGTLSDEQKLEVLGHQDAVSRILRSSKEFDSEDRNRG